MADAPPPLTSAQAAEALALYRQLLRYRQDGWRLAEVYLDSGLGVRPVQRGKRVDIAVDRNASILNPT